MRFFNALLQETSIALALAISLAFISLVTCIFDCWFDDIGSKSIAMASLWILAVRRLLKFFRAVDFCQYKPSLA